MDNSRSNEPGLVKLDHIALITPDLEKSSWFFGEMVGLNEVESKKDRTYFKGFGEWGHHSLELIEGEKAMVDHFAYRTREPDDVDRFADRLADTEAKLHWKDSSEEPGMGRVVQVWTPSNHNIEIFYEKTMDQHNSSSKLWNRSVNPHENGLPIRRINHINISGGRPQDQYAKWFEDNLRFNPREYGIDEEGHRLISFMSVTPFPHDLAYQADGTDGVGQLHHISFKVDMASHLFLAADRFREADIEIEVGPGRHAFTNAFFLYLRDPGSGHRVELGHQGYLILEPDWEPREAPMDRLFTWYGGGGPEALRSMGETTPFKVPDWVD